MNFLQPWLNYHKLTRYRAKSDIGLSPDGQKLGVTIESKGAHFVLLYDPKTRKLLDKIGGSTGYKDGKFEEAQFDYCMGLDFSLDSNTLYITECVGLEKSNPNVPRFHWFFLFLQLWKP
jgi:hypothetical protein